MDLKEFIENTLISIVGAVNEAQYKLNDTGVIINPSVVDHNSDSTTTSKGVQVIDINFDIAVSVSKESNNGKGGGIAVLQAVTLGAESKNKEENGQQNRIQFKVPVVLPVKDNLTNEVAKERYEILHAIASGL
ncbi:hypothetical protein ACQ1PF_10235 [Ornithobacterium rhinotracheale]